MTWAVNISQQWIHLLGISQFTLVFFQGVDNAVLLLHLYLRFGYSNIGDANNHHAMDFDSTRDAAEEDVKGNSDSIIQLVDGKYCCYEFSIVY